jgi:hypothetical protein
MSWVRKRSDARVRSRFSKSGNNGQ